MSLLNMLMQAQGGQGLGQLAEKLGMDQAHAQQLTEMLAPAIASGAKKRVAAGGTETMAAALTGEDKAVYLDNPVAAAEPEAQAAGQDFLAQILGSQEATTDLAAEAANRTGAGVDQVSQFLPALAAMLQGGMQKQMPDNMLQGLLGGAGGGGVMGMVGSLLGGGGSGDGSQGGALDMLTKMLDADGDGSALDDVLERFIK
ncbi:MAG: DUF937 domain-containing protein [Pseudomonadota bacterium]